MAPIILESPSSVVESILLNNYTVSDLRHDLDDFIMTMPLDSPQCKENFGSALPICQDLGLPLHPSKCVGPATSLVVLAIELD